MYNSNNLENEDDKKTISYAINKSTILNTIFTVVGILIFLIVSFLSKDYLKTLLIKIENQNSIIIFLIYILLFTIVSFPVVIGYLILIISCGYLLGMYKGLFAVVLAVNIGIFIAHNVMRTLNAYYPITFVERHNLGRALLKVLSGAQAYKLVLCTRLTPIPFGLQNATFALSSISWKRYHTASALGLFPAQLINVYLGSTLRSMHDVINNNNISTAGYIIFGSQLVLGITVMIWVLCKARIELYRVIKEAENEHRSITPDDDRASIDTAGTFVV